MRVEKHNFPATQYVQEVTRKRQIVLHHTVSGEGVNGDLSWWMKTPERVATAYLIDRQGVVHQLFDDKYWAYHLGMEQRFFAKAGCPYKKLDPQSVGIELDSWGALMPASDGKFYPVRWNTETKRMEANTKCQPVKYFYEYCQQSKFRGFTYFERYTTAQLDALRELLRNLCTRHGIPKTYNPDIWDVSKRALTGEAGIFTHASYRPDKSDAHPQPELINLIKTL